MSVVDYDLYPVPPRWLFLRLETDDGLVGWGEPVVEGRVKTTATAVEELVEGHLLGEDPGPIEDHWQTMYRGGFYRGGPVLMSAIAGIDQALWDIKGKRLGAPVYDLLGGPARERVRVYQKVGGDTPEAVGADTAETVASPDVTAVKTSLTPRPVRRSESPAVVDFVEEYVAAIREAAGPEVDVMFDFHGRVAKPLAKRLVARLDPYDLLFVEEPVLPEHNDHLPEVVAHTTTPVATGERLFSRWDFEDLLASGAVDVVQPDLSHAGGITEVHKIAAMAEAYDVALAPHCPLGPIAFAACVQVDVCAPNFLIQEQGMDVYTEGSHGRTYLQNPEVFEYEDGFVVAPDGPGLGIDVDEDAVRAAAQDDPDWHNPVVRHEDGSVGEW